MTALNSTDFDLIIIGAGINGAGIARDASSRGLKVMLLDKDDVASGTSSFSTRLIHGGLRYLEYGELGLVRESLRERETLLKIAPHLVRPLPMLIPIYKGMRRGRAKIRVGMVAYDLLSLDKSLPRHRFLSRAETLREIPILNKDELLGAVVYYDAQVEFPERLVLENVLAAVENGSTVVTHAEVEEFVTEGDQVIGLKYRGKSELVQASLIVNAAGPWIDRVLDGVDGSYEQLIGGTKGSHIVLAPFPGANSMAVYVEAQTDSRPFFIIPWNGKYLIGTTDIRFEKNPDEVRSESWEVDYLLHETNRVFPNANLSRSNVLYTYSGVRPLPFSKDESERGITRRHFIKEHPRLTNLLSIVGGKLTTYRSLAEECVDLLFHKLGKASPRCTTAELPLPGACEFNEFVKDFGNQTQVAPAVRTRLLRIYGGRAAEVVEFCRREGLSDYVDEAHSTLAGEIVFSFKRELARTLTDCLMRRTMLGLNNNLARAEAETGVRLAREFLSWSEQRAEDELHDFRVYTRRMQMEV
jgi:glycerol-3-phosphate dehydrogenase